MAGLGSAASVRKAVEKAVSGAEVLDVHTHIYPPGFGGLLLWGIDELLTYHYLVAELFRVSPRGLSYEAFWRMPKRAQADLIWKDLFIERSPVSEACRGVLTCMDVLGLDPGSRSLDRARRYFAKLTADEYVDIVFERSGVSAVVMTNNPFDDQERPFWEKKAVPSDKRFLPALRIDDILNSWPQVAPRLREWGYPVTEKASGGSLAGVRRFLSDWIARMKPVYMAASLPPEFRFPEDSPRGRLLAECVLPVSRHAGVPFAMMIGVKKLVNPALRLAGDGVGVSDVSAVENMCRGNPDNRFLVTALSRDCQHELAVLARKFGNLMPFGCWWFLNNPSIIEEMTRMRLELLGLGFIPQHSDARVLDQLLYKWNHSRRIIAGALAEKYTLALEAGWRPTAAEIERDMKALLSGNFERFVASR